uniref:DNA 3'-5' helicase n=2 Tax=Scylla olivacea TaxID=85551 RepID=A0A0N7ZA09_SCYOL
MPKTHYVALEHHQAYKENNLDQRLSHASQSRQRDCYTQDHNLTRDHQTEGHFYHQDQMCNVDDQEEQAGDHQAYQEGGVGTQGHQVHPGHVMHHQATRDHQIYTRASQIRQQQAVSHTMQGHRSQRGRFPVQLTSASCLNSSGREASAAGNQQRNASGGGMLRPVADIPAQYRSLFSQFPFFNIVQSTVFPDVFESDRSVVVSAPTGSGKTVVMELALVRLLITRDSCPPSDHPPQPARVVYMAPMKALVTERYLDWRQRLAPLNLTCAEITGDTEHDDITVIKNSQVILTTPEKWDFLTRRWRDHASLMQAVSLLLIDEVHVLNDEGRGPTLEAVVSRMKTIRATRPTHGNLAASPRLRFVAVSATIPNAEDVAAWLSDDPTPAVFHKLEESLRPVKLQRVVLGYDCRDNWTEFRFDLSLNYRLSGVITNYSENKPTLVFVSTRKAAQSSATTLAKEARLIRDAAHKQLLTTVANGLRDNKLRECVMYGVGFHHAGLVMGDRRHVEELFIAGQLPVLVATSTLAMGVNLPAHLVVVKSTTQYVGGAYEEYSSAQLLQMTGRAGRPQFDTHATAVIMTKNKHKNKYENLLSGRTHLESHLHLHLAEHLNAEIVLGTVTDLGVAVEWLRSTFLYVRVQHNPRHYSLPEDLKQAQLEARLQEMCTKEVNALAKAGVILLNEVDIKPTLPGRLMARYCVSFSTMKIFLQLSGQESLRELVEMVSTCQEFYDMKVRMAEKRVLNELNKSQTSAIRFPIKGKIKTREHKINCLVQATLGSDNIVDPGLSQEAGKIFRTGQRLTKCLAEYGVSRTEYELVLNTLLLAKCFSCRLWENSRFVTRQLERIGPTFSTALVQSKITSFAALEAASPRDIELILNRQPPFGNRIRDQAMKLPRYEVTVEQLNQVSSEKSDLRVTVKLANQEALKDGSTTPKHHACRLLLGNADNRVVFHQRITDALLKELGSVSRVVNVKRAEAGDDLAVNFISETWVGLDVQSTYTPRYLPRPASNLKATTTTSSTFIKNQGYNDNNTTANSTIGGSSMRGDGERRACLHTCGDKRNCAHTCCKVGVVSAKGSSGRGDVPAVVQEVRKRTTHLPDTPVKKLKSNISSGTLDISQFQYKPTRPTMLMPPPAQASRQQTFTSYPEACYQDGNQTKSSAAATTSMPHENLQTEDLITDNVLKDFENEVDFTQDINDLMDMETMEAFLVAFEKENLPKEYVDAFDEPLELEDIQGTTEDTPHTSWPQHHQNHTLRAATRPVPQQPVTLRSGLRPIRPSQATSSQSLRAQRQGIQMTQAQRCQRPQVYDRQDQGTVRPSSKSTTQTTLTRWLQGDQKHTAPPQTQTNQPQIPTVSQAQTITRPVPLRISQNQRPQASEVVTNQSQRCLRSAEVVTSQNQWSVRPTGVMANQSQRPHRPVGTLASQNEQPLMAAGVFANQNPQPLRQCAPMINQNVEPFKHAGTMARGNMPRSAGTLNSQNAQPFRFVRSQVAQTLRPTSTTAVRIDQRRGLVPEMVNNQAVCPPAHGSQITETVQNSQQALRGSLHVPLYLVTPTQRLPHIYRPGGPANHASAPNTQVPHTVYQGVKPRVVQAGQLINTTGPMTWQGARVEPIVSVENTRQWPSESEIELEHEAWTPTDISHDQPVLDLSCSAAPFPPGSVMRPTHIPGAPWHFQNQQQEQQPRQQPAGGGVWSSQSMEAQAPPRVLQMGINSLKQFCSPASDVEGSFVSHPPSTSHNDLPAPQTITTDMAFTSLESEYQNSVASTRSRYRYSSNILQLPALSESPTQQSESSATHMRPVAGIRPMVSDGTEKRKKQPDPFSHLTKEWNEMQRGKCKGKLSNIYLPKPSPRPLEKVRTSTPSPTTIKNNDDWKDLEMFQWCRQQEKLALHSLYQREAPPEAQYPPSDISKGHPVPDRAPSASRPLPRTNSLQITYDNGSQGHVVGVGLSGVGGARQNININLSSLDMESAANTQDVEEPQVRGILKKPTQSTWCVPDIYEGIT